jgi:hypothetical protein
MMAAGRLHLGATAVGEADADLGAHVAVIGGGDNAFDVSRMLAERGIRVTVIMRSKLPKAQQLLIERLRHTGHRTVGMRRAAVAALGSELGIDRLRQRQIRPIVWCCCSLSPNTDQPCCSRAQPARSAISSSTATWKRPAAA